MPNQSAVVLVFVSRRAVAEFDVNDAGPLILVAPADGVFARGVVGSQQDMHLGIDPIVIVSLIGDVEVLETVRDRIGLVGNVYAKMLIVLVG